MATNFFFYNETLQRKYLRNKFDFWNVHRIMNTLGLLQSHFNFARDPKYS